MTHHLDPVVTCNSTFGDVFGSLSSGLAAFLILWSTDSDYGPGGSSSATKSISSSTEMPKTYSEMQVRHFPASFAILRPIICGPDVILWYTDSAYQRLVHHRQKKRIDYNE